MHAVGQAHLGCEHRAELARADQADGDRAARSLPFEQHRVEVQGGAPSVEGVDDYGRPSTSCPAGADTSAGVVGSLAQRARDERFGAAFELVRRPAAKQDLRRTLLLGLSIETLAGGESLAAAGHCRRGLAIGPAARR